MGYRIIYDPEQKIKYPEKHNDRFGLQLAVALILLAAIAVLICNKTVNGAIKYFILPGDPIRTEAAMKELVEALKAGETIKDSVTAFCMEILHGAQI